MRTRKQTYAFIYIFMYSYVIKIIIIIYYKRNCKHNKLYLVNNIHTENTSRKFSEKKNVELPNEKTGMGRRE